MVEKREEKNTVGRRERNLYRSDFWPPLPHQQDWAVKYHRWLTITTTTTIHPIPISPSFTFSPPSVYFHPSFFANTFFLHFTFTKVISSQDPHIRIPENTQIALVLLACVSSASITHTFCCVIHHKMSKHRPMTNGRGRSLNL